MKRYLLAGAAALLLSTVAASAGSTFIIKLTGSPDVFQVTQQRGYFAQVHSSNGLVESYGVGMQARTRYFPNGFMLTDNEYNGKMQVCYNFENPLKNGGNGGHWVAYSTFNGHGAFWYGSGTYTVVLGR